MNTLTERRHWPFYVLDENGYHPPGVECNDPRSAMSTTAPNYDPHLKCGVKYPFRPPHPYSIKFMVVVNKDSLEMYRNWQNDTLSKETEPFADELQNLQLKVANNPKLKALSDSLNFYEKKRSEWTLQSFAQYFKDLLSGNKKVISSYEDKSNALEEKADFFRNKYDEELKRLDQVVERYTKPNLYEMALKDSRYIEGSVLVVTFKFNPGLNFSSADRFNNAPHYQASMYHSVRGAKYSFLLLAKTFPSDPRVGHYISEDKIMMEETHSLRALTLPCYLYQYINNGA